MRNRDGEFVTGARSARVRPTGQPVILAGTRGIEELPDRQMAVVTSIRWKAKKAHCGGLQIEPEPGKQGFSDRKSADLP
jgi:hypothetical protein